MDRIASVSTPSGLGCVCWFCARLGIWHCKRMAGSCGRDRRHRPCFRAVAEYRSWFCVLSEPRENRHSESQANQRKSLHMGKRSLRPHDPPNPSYDTRLQSQLGRQCRSKTWQVHVSGSLRLNFRSFNLMPIPAKIAIIPKNR